jgi:hypothetical protein
MRTICHFSSTTIHLESKIVSESKASLQVALSSNEHTNIFHPSTPCDEKQYPYSSTLPFRTN